MTPALNVHAHQNRGIYPPLQHEIGWANYLRDKIGSVLQDAVMETAKDKDRVCGFERRETDWTKRRISAVRDFYSMTNAELGELIGSTEDAAKGWTQGKAWPGQHAYSLGDALNNPFLAEFILNGDWRRLPADLSAYVLQELAKPPQEKRGRPRRADKRK